MKRFDRAVVVPGPGRITRRSCEAAVSLGVPIETPGEPGVHIDPRLVREALEAPGASITLITGPSGSGKSALLGAIRRALRARGERPVDADRVRPRPRPLVDLFPGDIDDALGALARAGLGEASLALRTPDELSVGQRARLHLALALRGAGDRAPLIIDEFGASLDRVTARTVSATLRRFASARPALRVFVATTRDDLHDALNPDVLVRIDLLGGAMLRPAPAGEACAAPDPAHASALRARSMAPAIDITRSPLSHALPLLSLHHYRPSRPARVARTLIATDSVTGETVGALVVAMPTLNARWRRLAWPGRFSAGSKAQRARRLNDELRTIARVVVDPRYRGVGVATGLVRAYLDAPLTPLAEAVSAMGRATRCFVHAGMRPVPLAPPERHARLLDALAHCTVEPWRLATPDGALARAIASRGSAFVEREVRRWAVASRATRRLAEAPLEVLFREACRAIGAERIAFVHGPPGGLP